MDEAARFGVGDPVVWRSRPDAGVGYVIAGRVLIDTSEIHTVVQPSGSQVAQRVGRRGGPRGRSMLPGGWDGAHTLGIWNGPTSVRLHPVGRRYSVIRQWEVDAHRYAGWYVNLERPWLRTEIGFDSSDLILDVTVTDDCRAWALKDEDELDWALEVGRVTQAEHEYAHAAAVEAIADLGAGRWPFDDESWPAVPAPCLEPVTTLPAAWNHP